jgi:hypothetical protein
MEDKESVEITKLREAIKKLENGGVVIIPKELDIEIKKVGENGYC